MLIEFPISIQCSWSEKFEIEMFEFLASGTLNWNDKFNEHVGEALAGPDRNEFWVEN